MPLVSVIMPVYNAEKYVGQAIESILNQTLSDFEFIIIDDASTDSSAEIIGSYKDTRIRFIQNEMNMGYVHGLNRMIDMAQGEFIARQDNDDISHHNRLKLQVDYLVDNPDIGMCGTFARYIGEKSGKYKVKSTSEDIKALLLFTNPVIHPSVMIRAGVFNNGLRYDEKLCPSEDYYMWFEISKRYKLANIPQTLLLYRIHKNNVSKEKRPLQIEKFNQIRINILEYCLGIILTNRERQISNIIFDCDIDKSALELIEKWLENVLLLGKKSDCFDRIALEKAMFFTWSIICRNNTVISPLYMMNKYITSRLVKYCRNKNELERIKTSVKILLRVFKC